MKVCYLIFGILPWCTLSGQTCIDDVDNVQQTEDNFISPNRAVIVPHLSFTCNGEITNIRVRISTFSTGTNFPYIQVWRQSPTSQLYSLVDQVQIQSSHLNTQSANLEANISLTGNNRIRFLSGDVIGFYNPSDSGYVIGDIQTDGYMYYVFEGANTSSLDLNNGIMSSRRQPLIQFTLVGGQTCIADIDNVQQNSNNFISNDRTVIVPRLNFTCNGRITSIKVRVMPNNTGTNFPYIQVWRQPLPTQLYSLVDGVQIQSSHISVQSYQEANILLTGNNRMQFLSGDVIGFYNPSDSGYVIGDIRTDGYVYYVFEESNASSLDLDNGIMSSRRQPVIQFTLDIQCNYLTIPYNGEISSCSSGSTGMGYEGDTCSFTCNTGYELTGSNTRTCQSDGSWSGSDDVCRKGGQTCIDDVDNVQQTEDNFISPNRTVIVPRLNFTCNGRISNIRVRISTFSTRTNFPYIQVWRQSPTSQLYSLVDQVQIQSGHLNTQLAYLEANISLTGSNKIQFLSGDVIGFYNPSDSRYVIEDIQTDGYVYYVFEGSNASSVDLNNGIMSSRRQPLIQFTLDIQCNNLTTPSNGEIASCSSGSIGMDYEGDSCSFTCSTGYELTGSPQRTCLSDGTWSGSPMSCTIMECPSSSLPINSMLAESCSSTYQSMCDLQCEEGFLGNGDPSYVCDVLSDGSVMWMASEGGWSCERKSSSSTPLPAPTSIPTPTSTFAAGSETCDDNSSRVAAVLGSIIALLAIGLVISIAINVFLVIQRKKPRVELQEMKYTKLPVTDKFSELNEPKEPTYDVIDGAQPVNITPNPATTSGTQNVKMSPSPAYGASSTVNKAEDPAYM
ncbi:uncharacterized protein [Dysidea avara]|uniref:uncharacterized protein isoform X3 n=1 Tax=Dysidea avara TaxID=196820 RepID=UPI0033328DED